MMKLVEVLGMPPAHLLNKATKAHQFFEQLSDGSYRPKKSPDGKQVGTVWIINDI